MRKPVLKIRIDAQLDCDPSNMENMLANAKKQETLKQVLKDQGFSGVSFKTQLGSAELSDDDGAASSDDVETSGPQDESE